MITKRTRNKLKKIIGAEYTEAVLTILNGKNIVNRLGNQHNQRYVIAVLNGERKNEDVENAIYELYSKKLKAIEKRKSILI